MRHTDQPAAHSCSRCCSCSPPATAPSGAGGARATDRRSFDVVVYGGTAGGVITAVAAAREGLKVALLEPGRHLGGMVSGGLGWTDYGRKEVIGGYSLEFFERVGKKYGRDIEWHFEPHVAEAVFSELVKEAGVRVFLDQRLREKSGVEKSGTRVTGIVMENGARFTREDLRRRALRRRPDGAGAACSYTWGREAHHARSTSRSPASASRRRSTSSAPRSRPTTPRTPAARRSCRARRIRSARPTSACRPTTSACA